MNEWDRALIETLKKYTDKVTDEVKEAVAEIAYEALPEIKNASPKKTGDYKKGWKVSERQGSTAVRALASVHNESDYQLTHLLEYGHRIIGRDGQQHGFAPAKTHIAPVNEKAQERLLKRIEDAIKKR